MHFLLSLFFDFENFKKKLKLKIVINKKIRNYRKKRQSTKEVIVVFVGQCTDTILYLFVFHLVFQSTTDNFSTLIILQNFKKNYEF